MSTKKIIHISTLCKHYNIEISFIHSLNDFGLIEIISEEESQYIHEDKITDVEKMIRIHQELNVNIEGIDVVFNLLNKIEELQNELIVIKNKLSN
ncbi:MAG: MerR family transcriptional regulator [Lutibacter sp.]|uniref:chaperone modulator CbpM n=1 Tax=Lutibacter sp. TaxID=1925666 RepID=UPI00181EC707|nr:chaperone modulator CbpM [Lutibacter sp.]MBT8316554.1 chaperone modulator CbpM [Lutibacter sp.]NNJ57414.1 MerR family transcriptional regulator [Lutibacter sp.]